MSASIYIDGKYFEPANATVSVFDHGFLYGDGVFEGIRFYNKRIFKLNEHIQRLFNSAKVIMLEVPLTADALSAAVVTTVKNSGLADGYIRLIVSRGTGDLGLDPRKCKKASIVIIPSELKMYPKELYDNGISLITVPTRRNINESLNPRIKSLNYLNNILAKIEAVQLGYEEAILLNHDGYVAECTGDNIFYVTGGVLYTPASHYGALKGITRDVIIDLAKEQHITVVEAATTRYDLYTADECFLTGTGAEVIPVAKIDARVIGTGGPGGMTRKLIDAFKKLVAREGVAVA
ncbi:MAG: branched-chain-amino-acid transaminase [Spirochaetes bacterium]|nr:branched-chain-amino-acid transaminase [Spirochaetota bacterium]